MNGMTLIEWVSMALMAFPMIGVRGWIVMGSVNEEVNVINLPEVVIVEEGMNTQMKMQSVKKEEVVVKSHAKAKAKVWECGEWNDSGVGGEYRVCEWVQK